MPRRLALTGTPGTGKTSVARELARRGWGYLDAAQYARDEGHVVEEDEARGSLVVDEESLAAELEAQAWPDTPVLVDAHFAHLLPCEAVVVLRCAPLALAERLRKRGWPEPKVRENVEAEAMSVVAEEADGPRVLELDTTTASATLIADEIERAFLQGPWPERRRVAWDLATLPWI